MKICIVADFFIPHYHGGGERRYYEIAKRLVKKGHQVDVICMKIAGVSNQEEIEGINIHHIGPTIDKPPQRSSSNFISFIFAVFKWILTHNYDIIDAQAYAPLMPAFLGAKLKRTPIIGTIHDVSAEGNDQWIQSSNIATFAEKILVRLPYNKILSVSHATKEALVKYYGVKKNRVSVVYAGVDLELIDSVKVNEKYENTIIFVGRLIPHKHVDHLLKIVKSLKKDIPTIKLIVVGNGTEKENLIKLTEEFKITDNVKFLHDLNYRELISEMKKSNVLALPSTREGFGMVLAEANACKIPVVAYASGGIVEVVEDGFNGFLVESLNIKKFYLQTLYLLKNFKKTKQMGINGRSIVEKNFEWDNILEKYEEILVRQHGHSNDNS
jgi:glycosyltransferase involved in cell wall biosynthesis